MQSTEKALLSYSILPVPGYEDYYYYYHYYYYYYNYYYWSATREQ